MEKENIQEFIEIFEKKKSRESKNEGVIYTPKIIADFIVSNLFRIYFRDSAKKLKLIPNQP